MDVRPNADLRGLRCLCLRLESFERSAEESPNGNTRLGLEQQNGSQEGTPTNLKWKGLASLFECEKQSSAAAGGKRNPEAFLGEDHETGSCNTRFPNFPGK